MKLTLEQLLKLMPAAEAERVNLDMEPSGVCVGWTAERVTSYIAQLAEEPALEVVCASSKRRTVWRNMDVTFNKGKTKFYRVLGPLLTLNVAVDGHLFLSDFSCQTNFAPSVYAAPLELNEHDKGSLVACWQAGKLQWAMEKGIIRNESAMDDYDASPSRLA